MRVKMVAGKEMMERKGSEDYMTVEWEEQHMEAGGRKDSEAERIQQQKWRQRQDTTTYRLSCLCRSVRGCE